MDVQDITDEKFAEVLKASLLDAGLDHLSDGIEGMGAGAVEVDGLVDLHLVAKHFRRRITAEPTLEEVS